MRKVSSASNIFFVLLASIGFLAPTSRLQSFSDEVTEIVLEAIVSHCRTFDRFMKGATGQQARHQVSGPTGISKV